MTNKKENIDMYVITFIMCMAVVNVVLVLTNASQFFLRPFSIGISVFLFYLAYKRMTELETFKKMKMLFYIHHLENEAQKEARKVIANAKQESKN